MLAATRRCIYLRQRVCKRGMVNGVCFTFAPILGLNGFNYRRLRVPRAVHIARNCIDGTLY